MSVNHPKMKWPAMQKILCSALPPNLALIYYARIKHWVNHKGLEWTALRLKALWNTSLCLRSGRTERIPEILREARIGASDGLPRGIEGLIVTEFAKIRKPSVLRRWASALRVYTTFTLPRASEAQIEKAKRSINSPYSGKAKPSRVEWGEKLEQENQFFLAFFPGGRSELVLHPLPSEVESPLTFQSLSGTSRYPADLRPFDVRAKDFKNTPFLSAAASLLTRGLVPSSLTSVFGDFHLRQEAESIQLEHGDDTFGRITVIQEGGAKGRVVCSPNAWVQVYMKPYHDYLSRVLYHLETKGIHEDDSLGLSCALDQVSGAYLALSCLESGKPAWCVDLSSATDRFPLWHQKLVCKLLGIPELGSILEDLKGPYLGPDGQKWSYGCGQPMGLYGSFPLFHLSHYALLNGLSHSIGLVGHHNFAVLGDDVIIFDPTLHTLYRRVLEEFGVPVSEHKSYTQDLLEFAGFIITRSKTGWTAFRPYKWAHLGKVGDVMNLVHALGKPVTRWSKSWSKSWELYNQSLSHRTLDLSPICPNGDPLEGVGGLPGSRYFGNLFNRLTNKYAFCPDLTETEYGVALDKATSYWPQEREALCHARSQRSTTQIIGFDTFDPEQYLIEENLRKQGLWSRFTLDPLVRASLG